MAFYTAIVNYGNGDTVITSVNGPEKQIREYFKIGKLFSGKSGLQPVTSLEIIPPLEFIGDCLAFRRESKANEKFWHEMMSKGEEISEYHFKSDCDLSGLLDNDETFDQWKEGHKVSFWRYLDTIFIKSDTGFEFVFRYPEFARPWIKESGITINQIISRLGIETEGRYPDPVKWNYKGKAINRPSYKMLYFALKDEFGLVVPEIAKWESVFDTIRPDGRYVSSNKSKN